MGHISLHYYIILQSILYCYDSVRIPLQFHYDSVMIHLHVHYIILHCTTLQLTVHYIDTPAWIHFVNSQHWTESLLYTDKCHLDPFWFANVQNGPGHILLIVTSCRYMLHMWWPYNTTDLGPASHPVLPPLVDPHDPIHTCLVPAINVFFKAIQT